MQNYREQLRKNPALFRALVDCLDRETDLTDDELLYLHVWAPALTEYVEWVLRCAREQGLRRLYFLARDAWPMYLMAEAICRSRYREMDCRYLKVSRYALRLPEYHLLGKDCVERICIGGIRVTLEKILRRAGLTGDEILAVARALGREDELQRELLYPEVLALKGTLSDCGVFMEAVQRHSREALPAALGYLEQEGLLDGVPCALVDSGWVGSLQQTLEHLLQIRCPGLRLSGFYFGLYELPRGALPTAYHAFYFDALHGMRRKAAFSNCLFETIFSSPAGMTLGYREEGDTFLPVESPEKNRNAARLERYGALLRRFAASYCEQPHRGGGPVCEGLLSLLMGRPQPWEVAAIGDNPFCDDVLEGTMQPAAAHLSVDEVKNLHFWRKLMIFAGLRKGAIHESAWLEGSIVRNGYRVRRELRQARSYKYVVYMRKLWKNKRILQENNTFSSSES